jgi:predicted transcriptional regulator
VTKKEKTVADAPTVSEWMDDPPEAFRQDEPMRGAINFLSKSEFSAMPVVDDAGSLVGLLTEKDALRTIAGWTYDSVAGGTVADYMSELKVRLASDMDLLTALRAFLECNFACLPVTQGNRMVGCLSRDNLLKGMVAWATAIDEDRDKRLSSPSEIERPSSIEEMQRVAASHTPNQLVEIFRERRDK